MNKTPSRDPNLPATCSRKDLLIGGDDTYLRLLIDRLSTLSWLLERIRGSLAQAVGVSPFQYKILQTIGRIPAEGGWSVGTLARHFRVTDAYASTEVSDLIALRFLKSTINPEDRRGKFLELTDKAFRLLTLVATRQQQANDLTYGQFSKSSLVQFGTYVEKMVDDAEAANALLSRLQREPAIHAVGPATEQSKPKVRAPRSIPNRKNKIKR